MVPSVVSQATWTSPYDPLAKVPPNIWYLAARGQSGMTCPAMPGRAKTPRPEFGPGGGPEFGPGGGPEFGPGGGAFALLVSCWSWRRAAKELLSELLASCWYWWRAAGELPSELLANR